MTYLSHTKNMENFMEALLRDHKRYLPIVEFLDNVIQGMAELSWADCELIGRELGEQNGSAFCAGIRGGMIGALGADKAALQSERLQPVLTLARKLNRDSSAVAQADIQSLRDAGWSDQTAEDVAGLVAILKVYSILANGLGFDGLPEAAFAEMGQATVQMQGYTPMFRAFVEKAQAAPKAKPLPAL